jgi:hypothetical protein
MAQGVNGEDVLIMMMRQSRTLLGIKAETILALLAACTGPVRCSSAKIRVTGCPGAQQGMQPNGSTPLRVDEKSGDSGFESPPFPQKQAYLAVLEAAAAAIAVVSLLVSLLIRLSIQLLVLVLIA